MIKFLHTHFARTFCSSPPSPSPIQNLSKTLSLQNLLKSGFTPTLQSFNQFLSLLHNIHKFNYLLHFFSQMNSNNITTNSKTHSLIALSLVKSNRLEEAQQFIKQMLQNGVLFKRGLWDSLIQCICSSGGGPEKAFLVLQDGLKLRGISPSRCTFCLLIHSFSSLGNMGRAIEVLELMTSESFGYSCDNFVCSTVISGFCKIGKPELALGFYDNVEKVGSFCRPNVVTYTAIVNALCKEGRVKEVCDLVHRMENEGIVLDAVFYSSWICGYFEKGVLEEAFQKHREMLGKGIRPDTVSYTILIDGFSKEGNVEKAVGFLKEMGKDGLQPNLVTYTAIIRGYCRKGKLEEAFNVFKRVKHMGFEPDEVTYSTLIDGLCRIGEFDCVFMMLEEMEKKGISIGIITYNTVINGLCKVGRTNEADEISNDISSDSFTFSTLLHGYCKENNINGIMETKRRIEEARVQMDVVMCNVLIKALFMVGAMEDVQLIYKEMKDMGLVADSVTYYTMIDGYCRKGRIYEALEIFDACRQTSSVVSVGSYSYIVKMLCGNGMVDMAIDVFTELIGKSQVPGKDTFMVLLRSILDHKSEKGLLNFVFGFETIEHQMLDFIGNGTIYFLCKRGLLNTAFDLYVAMRNKGLGVTSKCYYLILKGLIADGNEWPIPIMLNHYIKEYGVFRSKIRKMLVTYLCVKDMTKSISLLDNMKHKRLSITMPIAAVEELVKQGRALDAYKLALKARGSDTSSDIVAYSIVVDGLCKEGHLHKALDLCATMRDRGISPNYVTYNSVMNGLCQQGCLPEALRLFDSFENISLDPTDITYGTLISALSKEGYLQDAKQLLEKMVSNGLTPNTHTYNSLIAGYSKFGLLDDAKKLLTSLGSSCYVADAFTVSAVINGFCRKGDMEGALTFYYEFKRKEITPDFFGFHYLVEGLCVKGRMEEARSILRDMLQVQPIVEVINKAGIEIETESLANVLGSFCEQGNIEEATFVLGEVCSRAFFSRTRYTGATSMTNPDGREALCVSPRKNISRYVGNLPARCSAVLNLSSGLENSDCSWGQSILYDFNAYYTQIASLCSEGNLDKANQVARELLMNM